MPTYQLISSVTVGAGGASSIDFTSIPSTYTDLLVKVQMRTSRAAEYEYTRIRFNSDTATNYKSRWLYGDGGSAASTNDMAVSSGYLFVAGANATSNTFGNAEIYIPNYTSSNQKSFSTDSVTENNATVAYTGLYANLWTGTSAITSITIVPANLTTIQQYSTAYLYGIKNS